MATSAPAVGETYRSNYVITNADGDKSHYFPQVNVAQPIWPSVLYK